MKISTIFLDLDDVLCDFVGRACDVHGVDRRVITDHRRANKEWSMVPAIAATKGQPHFDDRQFWQPIQEGRIWFWETLEPLPWAKQLVTALNNSGIEWYLLSAPTKDPHCYTGKLNWIDRFFGADFRNFILTPHKELMARSGTLLIDDSHHNLQRFTHTADGYATGGQGYLFPTSPLAHIEDAIDPLASFTKFLERIIHV